GGAGAAARRRAARLAYIRRINAWHADYYFSGADGIYYRWRRDLGCAAYSDYCWRIEVITRDGCGSLFVEANEMSGGTSVGDLIDSRDNVAPRTPVLLELDSTSGIGNTTASAPTITCY